MSKGKTTRKPKTTPSGKMSPIEIAEISGRAVECITDIIHTIGEERRKTEEAKTERLRISAEMEAQISKAENETARLLGQYQVEIERMANETKLAGIEASKEIEKDRNAHEERMRRINTDHERRMRQLDLIGKIVDVVLRQFDSYSSYVIINPQTPDGAPIINLQMLDAMNSAISRLNDTLERASLDAPSL